MTAGRNLVDNFVSNATISEVFEGGEAVRIYLGRLDLTVDNLTAERDILEQRIAALKQAGISDGKPFWNGRKYLYLIHPMVNGTRSREYIGPDAAKISRALAAVERYKDYLTAESKLAIVNRKIQRIITAIKDVLEWL